MNNGDHHQERGGEVEVKNAIELAIEKNNQFATEQQKEAYQQNRFNELISIAQNSLSQFNNNNNNDNNNNNNNDAAETSTWPAPKNSLKPHYPGVKVNDLCYIPEGRKSCAPQYIIAGAMKCGTTSMFAYLTSHPKILPLNPGAKLNGKPVLANKEVRCWLDPSFTAMVKSKSEKSAFLEYLDLFYPITVPHQTYFPDSDHSYDNYITGEASPMYICQQGLAKRIHDFLPEMKIIIMLRNPIDRAYSELWFKDSLTKGSLSQGGLEATKSRYQSCLLYESELLTHCNIKDYLYINATKDIAALSNCVVSNHNQVRSQTCKQENKYLCEKFDKRVSSCSVNNLKNSLYALQLKEWFDVFPRDQLFVIKSEDFYENTSEWMRKTTKFLGVEEGDEQFDWDPITTKAFNIVNPGTASAQGMQIQSPNGAGLKMGSTDAEKVGQYPDMDESFRHEMSVFFDPINKFLGKLTQQPLFWRISSHKGDK